MPIIVPTIFVFDQLALEERLLLFDGLVERVQLDIADANFTPQPTLPVEVMVEQPTILKRDVHLMVAEPVEYLGKCQEEAVNLVVGQIESMASQFEFKKEAEALNMPWGLAIDADTPVKDLDWAVAQTADQILIMTVRAGKEGQKFNFKSLEKVKEIRANGFRGEVCVDGGVSLTTIAACIKAGADVLAVGSSINSAKDPAVAYQELQRLAGKNEF